MTRLENGVNIGDRASGLGSQYKGYGYLAFRLKFFRNDPILRPFSSRASLLEPERSLLRTLFEVRVE